MKFDTALQESISAEDPWSDKLVGAVFGERSQSDFWAESEFNERRRRALRWRRVALLVCSCALLSLYWELFEPHLL